MLISSGVFKIPLLISSPGGALLEALRGREVRARLRQLRHLRARHEEEEGRWQWFRGQY